MPDASDEESVEAVNRDLYRRGSTDGLPVIPPTEEAVSEMLRGTDLPPDHVIGELGNRKGKLTVEVLATNAVMAGCTPVHMPVLVAGGRALVDPESNAIQVSVSTGSWAYLWIINGPIRDQIDVRSDTGAFGPGFMSNRTIGRALGLAYKNTAIIHPGEKDMATLGNPFKFSLVAGENEERSPFEPYHVAQGFEPDESTITFGGPHGMVQYTNRFGSDAFGVFKSMIYNTPPDMVGLSGESADKRVFHVLAPYNADELADAGLTRSDVKQYLCENATVPHFAYQRGIILQNETDSDAVPRLQVPQYEDPDQVEIFVVGGSGRVNGVLGGSAGGPVTKRIELPDDWDGLVDEYAIEREWGPTTGS